MIQFNLLPDIKREYIKTQQLKRLVIGVSVIASVAALFILMVLLFSVFIVQKSSIENLNNTINIDSSTLKNKPNLASILTVQGQLNSLSSLASQDPVASRLFGFLAQVTPSQATISDLQIDFTQDTITITGNASDLAVINTYVDNLKFTSYTISGQSSSKKAFSSVVLTSFSPNSTSSSGSSPASYSITLNFDPVIFNNADSISLDVGGAQPLPSLQQPSIIFSKGN